MKVFAITGYSGAGKTTLIEKLIAHFVGDGLRVAALKHAHEGFDLDTPGKDSYRMRAAGASQVLISAPKRWVLMEELHSAVEPSLLDHLQRMAQVDLVLVEGWKFSVMAKLEVHRGAVNKSLRYRGDASIMGIASDTLKQFADKKIAVFGLNDVSAIADFVLKHAQTPAQIETLESKVAQMQPQQQ